MGGRYNFWKSGNKPEVGSNPIPLTLSLMKTPTVRRRLLSIILTKNLTLWFKLATSLDGLWYSISKSGHKKYFYFSIGKTVSECGAINFYSIILFIWKITFGKK